MNKIKAILWIVLVGFVLVVFFSNLDFFLESKPINLNFVIKNYSLPAMPYAVISLLFFAAGLLVAFISNLPARFRFRKTIKNLKATIDSQEKEIERIRTSPKSTVVTSVSDDSN